MPSSESHEMHTRVWFAWKAINPISLAYFSMATSWPSAIESKSESDAYDRDETHLSRLLSSFICSWLSGCVELDSQPSVFMRIKVSWISSDTFECSKFIVSSHVNAWHSYCCYYRWEFRNRPTSCWLLLIPESTKTISFSFSKLPNPHSIVD